MVIHHLDTDFENFPNLNSMVKRLYTLLKPNGKLCINHCYEENLRSVWYFTLNKTAFKNHSRRFAKRDILKTIYKNSGLLNYQEVKCT